MLKIHLICGFIITCLYTQAQIKTPVDSVHFLLDTTIAIMQKKALNADKVNWTKLTQTLKQQTAKVNSVKEAGFAFTRVYDELKDTHGAFY